jgi:hypothetical protein
VFEISKRQRRTVQVDLASVRETLLYIESDLGRSPQLNRLAATIRSALAEIERLEQADFELTKPEFATARFLPANFDN